MGWYNSGDIVGARKGQKIGKLGNYLYIPHRRDGKFTSQEHTKSAWAADGLHWIHPETRGNQTRFFNKVKRNIINLTKDGLSSLDYEVLQTDTFMGDCKYVKVDI